MAWKEAGMQILGIDVGGSGIKGAPVDTVSGEILAPRCRFPTPEPSKPGQVAKTVAKITHQFNWQGLIGVGFPSPIHSGVVLTAANIHKSWVNTDAVALFSNETGCQTYVMNDADAAGLAEMKFGAGKGRQGVVLIVTIGTGLGTALFTDGCLLPNTELGHIEMNGEDAERQASDAARKREDLSWKKWSKHFDQYLHTLERLFYPDLIILGGGASKKADLFLPLLTVKAEVVPAQMQNEAGIIGAALAAGISAGTKMGEGGVVNG
jgi:polyphosphate glucokinase